MRTGCSRTAEHTAKPYTLTCQYQGACASEHLDALGAAQDSRRSNDATLMKSARHLAIAITITVISSFLHLGEVSVAQPPTVPARDCRYFARTGHHVCGKFLDFFETRGGLEIFGYPLTQAFVDPTHHNLRVQYFQRARMEEHPSNPPAYQVQLGLLVDELGHVYPPAGPEEVPAPGDPAHHYFPETQHVVSHAFLTFFREHGSLDIFGYPRSEMIYEDGLVVQYFQRARMEWHRENPPGQQIILSNVGEWYIERFGIPGDYDQPREADAPEEGLLATPSPERSRIYLPYILVDAQPTAPAKPAVPAPTKTPFATPTSLPTPVPLPTSAPPPTAIAPSNNVTALDVSGSVRYPITGRTGTQTVYVYVNDQLKRPVPGAEVTMVVHYESGDRPCVAEPTDVSGFTRCSFDIPSPPVGKQVVIDITVTYEGLTGETQTSFMVWW